MKTETASNSKDNEKDNDKSDEQKPMTFDKLGFTVKPLTSEIKKRPRC